MKTQPHRFSKEEVDRLTEMLHADNDWSYATKLQPSEADGEFVIVVFDDNKKFVGFL